MTYDSIHDLNNCDSNPVTNTAQSLDIHSMKKMKDGPLSKLTITKGGQEATQYKKIVDALPVFCVDKGYRSIDDVNCMNTKLLEAAF